jgi:tyrosine-specific transport protein
MDKEAEAKQLPLWTVSLLIAGSTIGAGILGLPVKTGLAGFVPSLTGISLGWLFMFISGWVIAERFIRCEKDSDDLPTVFQKAFGPVGKYVAITGYLINYYGIMVAYLCASIAVVKYVFPVQQLPNWTYLMIFFIPATVLTLFGLKYILKANAFFMFLLGASFLLMLIMTSRHIEVKRLTYTDWAFLPSAMPLIITAFVYHNIIPSVCRRLEGQPKTIWKAMLIGTLIPLVVNILWTLVILGALPLDGEGSGNILYAYEHNNPGTLPLATNLKSKLITTSGMVFSLAAIFTSYVSVAIGLKGFFKDIISPLKLKVSNQWAKALTFLPPLAVALIYPDLFLSALNISGGVGVVMIFGILPSLMLITASKRVWKRILGRILLAFSIIIMLLEIAQEIGWLDIKPNVEIWNQNNSVTVKPN